MANVVVLETTRAGLRIRVLVPLCIHVHLVGRQGLEPRIFRLRAGYIAAYVCSPNLVGRVGIEPTCPRRRQVYSLPALHKRLATQIGGPPETRTPQAVSLQGKPGCPARSPLLNPSALICRV